MSHCNLEFDVAPSRLSGTVYGTLDEKTIIGPMISQAHLAKVRSYIEPGPRKARP
ncbi:MAG: hypothetical protein JWP65_858 [Ramlibacter sp.]|jgi:acyl-CoA reductase-like NAD-dependent aldehyde dehydrogenase|nr:hypothetical protein [Ramlibacter sp.]